MKPRARRFIRAALERSYTFRTPLSRAIEYRIHINSLRIVLAFRLLISHKINLSGCVTQSGRELKDPSSNVTTETREKFSKISRSETIITEILYCVALVQP